MRAVHRLQILHRIPVVLDKDDCIRPRQRQPKSTNMCGEKQAVDARVRVERLHDRMPLVRVRRAVEAHVRHRGHVLLEEVALDDVEHLLHLAEDQHTVLRERARPSLLGIHQLGLGRVAGRARRKADTAIQEELSREKNQPWDESREIP